MQFFKSDVNIDFIGKQKIAACFSALLILAVLGSIFAGITTPTEASGVGALGASILAASNRRLNLKVIAEGVENAAQEAFLLNEGCEEAQGFFYAPPQPVEEIHELLGRENMRQNEA